MADGSMTFRDIGQDCLASAMRLLSHERLTEESLGDPEDRAAVEAVRQRLAALPEVSGSLARYVVSVDDRARPNDWCDLRVHVRVDGGTALTMPVNVDRASWCPQPLLSPRGLLFALSDGDPMSWRAIDAIAEDDIATTYQMILEGLDKHAARGDFFFLIVDDLDDFAIEALSLFSMANLRQSVEYIPFTADWPPQRLATTRSAPEERSYIHQILLESEQEAREAAEEMRRLVASLRESE